MRGKLRAGDSVKTVLPQRAIQRQCRMCKSAVPSHSQPLHHSLRTQIAECCESDDFRQSQCSRASRQPTSTQGEQGSAQGCREALHDLRVGIEAGEVGALPLAQSDAGRFWFQSSHERISRDIAKESQESPAAGSSPGINGSTSNSDSPSIATLARARAAGVALRATAKPTLSNSNRSERESPT